jgi:hypothetical protein
MGPVYGEEWRLEKNLPIGSQHTYLGNGQEFLIQVELILDALVPTNMDAPAHQVLCRLYGCVNGPLRDNVCKYLALFIVFNGHIASYMLYLDNLCMGELPGANDKK